MKKTVLVVDDSKAILSLLYYFLSEKYNVEKKLNGKEALEWMQKGNFPDVIITDVNMPEMNGSEFISHLNSSGFFKDIPVIVLSTVENSAEKVKFLKMGACDFVVKPFNPEELEIRISNLFRDKHFIYQL